MSTADKKIEEVLARFEEKVSPEPNTGCWLWTAAVGTHGYGMFGVKRRILLAHRVSYELNCAKIPDGSHIDHKCRNRLCVNPDHLEVVSQAENNRRIVAYGANSNTQKTHCPKGHPYSGDNLFIRPSGARGCRACLQAAQRNWRQNVRPQRKAS